MDSTSDAKEEKENPLYGTKGDFDSKEEKDNPLYAMTNDYVLNEPHTNATDSVKKGVIEENSQHMEPSNDTKKESIEDLYTAVIKKNRVK